MGKSGRSSLIEAYLQRRPDLQRFFALRLGSASAAEDLVQDIYLRLKGVDADAQIDNPVGYLYRLGSNLMIERLRGERRAVARDAAWREAHHLIQSGEDVADEVGAEDVVAARQRLAAVVQVVGELPPQTQRVFRLHKLEGLSHAEVAARLGISRSAVEKHMITVLRRLAERLA